MASEQIQPTNRDPSAVAQTLAQKMVAAEEEKLSKRRRKLDAAAQLKRDEETGKVMLSDGRLVNPMAAFPTRPSADFTARIPKELIKVHPDYGPWCVRWIRVKDLEGRAEETEFDLRQQYGYEVIINPKDGEPFRRGSLIAMQGPPEGLALYMAQRAKPGTMNANAWHEAVENVNRRAGKRVVEPMIDDRDGPEDPAHIR